MVVGGLRGGEGSSHKRGQSQLLVRATISNVFYLTHDSAECITMNVYKT